MLKKDFQMYKITIFIIICINQLTLSCLMLNICSLYAKKKKLFYAKICNPLILYYIMWKIEHKIKIENRH